ncbi:MAG: hypothetical protein NC204_07495 [Candidatus Amulumruptor caecigallinarius]|nr:hypothetical protein [Candidatus Amulumruptor caecigallinarius]
MKNFLFLLLVAFSLAAVSCKKPTVESVAQKYINHEQLSEAEYDLALNYVNDGMRALSDSISKYENDPRSLNRVLFEMMEKYEYNNEMAQLVYEADSTKLTPEQLKLQADIEMQKERNRVRFTEVFSRMQVPSNPQPAAQQPDSIK